MQRSSRLAILVGLVFALTFAPAKAQAGDVEERGISTGRYITSGILSTVVGFGVGHAVQGRYLPLGLVFTLTEATAMTVFFVDTTRDVLSGKRTIGTAAVISLIALGGLHVWEVVDAWVVGSELHNKFQSRKRAEVSSGPRVAVLPVMLNDKAPGMSLMMRF